MSTVWNMHWLMSVRKKNSMENQADLSEDDQWFERGGFVVR